MDCLSRDQMMGHRVVSAFLNPQGKLQMFILKITASSENKLYYFAMAGRCEGGEGSNASGVG
jgi:hypothetical protein